MGVVAGKGCVRFFSLTVAPKLLLLGRGAAAGGRRGEERGRRGGPAAIAGGPGSAAGNGHGSSGTSCGRETGGSKSTKAIRVCAPSEK